MSSKVHSQGNIPFSWENKPGVSKAAAGAARQDYHRLASLPKVPPPPCLSDDSGASFHPNLQIPLKHTAVAQQNYHHLAPPPKLPLPPCPSENSRVSFHDLQIPLPPCAFQPPSRSSSRKCLKKMDDPFLIAYKEVTKSTKKGKSLGGNRGDQGLGLMKNLSIFSCKQTSCSVAEDSVIKLSQLPISRSRRDAGYN